jgi:hypothetical protein
MKTSDSITKIAPALLKAQKAITFAKKDATNPHFKSKYADLSGVIEAVKGPLNEQDMFFSQMASPSEDGRLHLTTRLLHSSGEWVEDTAVCPLPKADPQGFGSALTYLKRYSLAACVGLPTEDDDGNAGSHTPTEAQPRPAQQRAPAPRPPPAPSRSDAPAWQGFPVPPFIKKYAGATLGEMEKKDLLWWSENYEPKPFKGEIQQKDLDFQAALKAGAEASNVPDGEGDVPW